MSRQEQDERPQGSFEANAVPKYRLDAGQPQLFTQGGVVVFLELRFVIALLSVLILLTMSVVNLVLERLLETVLYGLGPYFPSALRILFYTLPPLILAILLTLLLVWLNGFVRRQTRPAAFSHSFGEKLVVSRPASTGQRLALAFLSSGLALSAWFTVTIYLRFGPYLGNALSEVTIARLAAIPLVTTLWLVGAALWINVIFHRRYP